MKCAQPQCVLFYTSVVSDNLVGSGSACSFSWIKTKNWTLLFHMAEFHLHTSYLVLPFCCRNGCVSSVFLASSYFSLEWKCAICMYEMMPMRHNIHVDGPKPVNIVDIWFFVICSKLKAAKTVVFHTRASQRHIFAATDTHTRLAYKMTVRRCE